MIKLNVHGHTIEIPDEIVEIIEKRIKRKIPIREYERIVKPYLKPLHDKYKYPYKSLYLWLIQAYIEFKRTTVPGYKVLAVKTFCYTSGKGRHIECRMIIDVKRDKYNEEFFNFCSECIDIFLEYLGYTDLIIHSKQRICIEKIGEVYLKKGERIPFFIEVYDYDYDRYPFDCKGTLSYGYWNNYVNAIAEFHDEIVDYSEHCWRSTSELDRIVNRYCGSEDVRFR